MSDPLLVTRSGAVATLTLNRPQALNALDVPLKEALREQLVAVADDDGVRAVVLAGAGRAFCVGQDLREHAAALAGAAPLDTVRRHYVPIATVLAGLPKPVVAAVGGMAAGAGLGLALLADFRIGGPSTRLLTAFATIGLAADTALSWTLPRLVGRAKAAELLLLSEPVPAAEAHRLGLLSRLADSDEAVPAVAAELAARLAAGPTTAYAEIKRELAGTGTGTLADALEAEARAQEVCGATADHRDATAAFLAKQRPTFTGH
jgi:2-(1,2-epoxy-1,2-dihydrophenyl)acetyl-CoA isomerase